MSNYKPDPRYTISTIRFPKEFYRELRLWTVTHGSSIQHEVVSALQERMERHQREEKEVPS